MTDLKQKIEAANQKTIEIILSGSPMLVDVAPAREVVPGMTDNMILHSAPAIAWEDMCGPHKVGVIGAALWEGLASSPEDADSKIRRGEILVEPCHHHDSVGAGAGITSASTPMLVVENTTYGNRAYSCISEGGGLRLLKWGAYDEDIAKHLSWQAEVLGPVLQKAVRASGGIDVKSIVSRAVQMGDECHNRTVASTGLFLKELYGPLVDIDGVSDKDLLDSIRFMVEADQFFLHGIMAAAKAILLPAKGLSHSTIVTAMARNGVEFGIQVAGLGDRWFRAPANPVNGLYFRSEWSDKDAAPDLGDSAITETVGLGGFIQPAAPTVQQYVQGSLQQAIANTQEMTQICAASNNDVRIPAMDFAAAPIGIDIRKVVQTGIAPLIDTAITHKEGGLIGAGEVRAPIACFEQALKAFAAEYMQ
ncbi:MAG: DUF1116 domain-containing protein [Spongiibacter sp.]|uniref:DUF1116 domain-containing protein n=1 Tax=Spongiibacter TaxID=630749 RepID=UPI000C691694|nr:MULTISPECIES: DUF1116 domain-containing protein [Spongiibacter]MBO6753859.1 DUF1116 domain-containing protein [Spongiibacter sp.]MBU73822.1 hypothetical protein [Spongiibacter sp.]|tara:strand:+ start:856 stop:2115 length:1260 start_codon:yes stop_codon:yes gene_type:complete